MNGPINLTAPYLPPPDPVSPAWLTEVLRAAHVLTQGAVSDVEIKSLAAFNSATVRLRLRYADAADDELPKDLILKRNIEADWAVEAGREEVAFYRMVGEMDPRPPAIVPCFAAATDVNSSNSYLLLQDLSATHVAPVSGVDNVPSPLVIDQVVETLARHHATWWDHPKLASGSFQVGYWSRNAERFALYVQRRRAGWDALIAEEAAWLPDELRKLYADVFDHLEAYWARDLEPRFRTPRGLTLVHGDAYFDNFLCPKSRGGASYLLDWQSPTAEINGYDLANLIATFWTSEQRREAARETRMLRRYLYTLQEQGVEGYTWDDLVADYQAGLIFWLLMPLQDRYDGSPKEYWWPKMQCLVSAFLEWDCDELLGIR